jgi:putative PEP-CTERM system histidine kinase
VLTVGVGSFGVASAAFLGLAAFVCLGWIGRHWAMIGLIATTLAWAALGFWFALEGHSDQAIFDLLDFARSVALLFLVNDALHRLSGGNRDGRWLTEIGILVPTAAIVALVLGVLRLIDVEDAFFFSLIGHVAMTVIGLFLVENLFKISRPNSLWTTKHLLIGAGTIFAFDLFYYTEALLFLRPDEMIRNVQPIIAVLAMPLLLISARRLNDVLISLPVSRGLLVSTTALLASGVYILCVAAIAYLIRGLGWAWGPTLQLIFLIGAAMVLLVLLSSTSLRHGGRRFIERNLFTFAYDYRREWLRLVNNMAKTEDELPLDKRALQATADLMDADGGVLFLRCSNGDLDYKSSWNIAIDGKTPRTPPLALRSALSPKKTAIVFEENGTVSAGLDDDDIKRWLGDFRDPWIALGLFTQDDLVGLITITRPRMRRRLTWEDLDLLEIFSHQLGSYLTVEELARQVADAEHFDRMSKHVTFVAHDLKNLISQLSLVLQQAKYHANNPDFVSDSFLTIGDAVEKMTLLMRRVQEGALAAPLSLVDLKALVQEARRRHRCDHVETAIEGRSIVKAEATVLSSLIDHIIDNAREASGDEGRVTLALREDNDTALLSVSDNGPGMTRDFIETELFKPFASTKTAGFGIGMYQCRDWVQRWRGQLTVESVIGSGTTVTVALPLDEKPVRENNAGESPASDAPPVDIDTKASNPLQPAEEQAA